MDSRDVIGLYEAYFQVYEDQQEMNESVDEEYRSLDNAIPRITAAIRRAGTSDATGGIKNADRVSKMMTVVDRHNKKNVKKRAKSNRKRGGVAEDLDTYDLVLEYLLDEGYCDDEQSAEVIMANMSEEWLGSILEANKGDEYVTSI